MSLSDPANTPLSSVALIAQTLGGQVKQADADVAEAHLQAERAKAAAERAEKNLTLAIERRADLSRQIDSLADKAAADVRAFNGARAQAANGEAVHNSGFIDDCFNDGKGAILSSPAEEPEPTPPAGDAVGDGCTHLDRDSDREPDREPGVASTPI